jgi:hypothetical protein
VRPLPECARQAPEIFEDGKLENPEAWVTCRLAKNRYQNLESILGAMQFVTLQKIAVWGLQMVANHSRWEKLTEVIDVAR